jgi:hypothetical protein
MKRCIGLLLSALLLAPLCVAQVPDDRDPGQAEPISNIVEALLLSAALDWLCDAVSGVTTLNPPESDAVQDCVKKAKRDIEKALLGIPQGPDANGDERPPKEIVLIDSNTGWGQKAEMAAYTTPEEFDPSGGTLTSSSSALVGEGHERVVISQNTVYNAPWLLCSVLAHEGKRLGQSGGYVDANNPTVPEKKKMAEGDLKAYCTNIAVLRASFSTIFMAVQNETPGSDKMNYLSAQLKALSERIKEMQERKKKAQEKKVKYCA